MEKKFKKKNQEKQLARTVPDSRTEDSTDTVIKLSCDYKALLSEIKGSNMTMQFDTRITNPLKNSPVATEL